MVLRKRSAGDSREGYNCGQSRHGTRLQKLFYLHNGFSIRLPLGGSAAFVAGVYAIRAVTKVNWLHGFLFMFVKLKINILASVRGKAVAGQREIQKVAKLRLND